MLLDFAMYRRQNETWSRRSTCVKNNDCSQRDIIWQTDATGLQKCGLGLPSNLPSPRQLTTIRVCKLSNRTL
jgi:hypothetical protein